MAPRCMTPHDRAVNAIEDALMEVRRAQNALEDALNNVETSEVQGTAQISRDEDKAARLVRVSKSLLNGDGVFTLYDLALAIQDMEGPQ